jgi:hypothetical protein
MRKKGDAAPPAKAKGKDASLNGKTFQLTEGERDSCAQLLEKVQGLRQQASQLEQHTMLKARKYVLERIGASPEAVARAQVQIHRKDGVIVAVEVTDAAPPQEPAPPPPATEPPAPELKALKGGKKKAEPPPAKS